MSNRKILSLARKELFRLDSPEEETELEKEVRRLFQVTEELRQQFDLACEMLLCAYVESNGSGAIAQALPPRQIATTAVDKERKAWVVPIANAEEMKRKIEKLKRDERFRQCVHLYRQSSPIPPHQAMVVQAFKGGNTFEIVYRVREDLAFPV